MKSAGIKIPICSYATSAITSGVSITKGEAEEENAESNYRVVVFDDQEVGMLIRYLSARRNSKLEAGNKVYALHRRPGNRSIIPGGLPPPAALSHLYNKAPSDAPIKGERSAETTAQASTHCTSHSIRNASASPSFSACSVLCLQGMEQPRRRNKQRTTAPILVRQKRASSSEQDEEPQDKRFAVMSGVQAEEKRITDSRFTQDPLVQIPARQNTTTAIPQSALGTGQALLARAVARRG